MTQDFAEYVSADEVKDAVLRILKQRFHSRTLSWQDAMQGLASAALEIKQMELFAPPIEVAVNRRRRSMRLQLKAPN